jgi:hypothetical protein
MTSLTPGLQRWRAPHPPPPSLRFTNSPWTLFNQTPWLTGGRAGSGLSAVIRTVFYPLAVSVCARCNSNDVCLALAVQVTGATEP